MFFWPIRSPHGPLDHLTFGLQRLDLVSAANLRAPAPRAFGESPAFREA